jgi:hypothetical protein
MLPIQSMPQNPRMRFCPLEQVVPEHELIKPAGMLWKNA